MDRNCEVLDKTGNPAGLRFVYNCGLEYINWRILGIKTQILYDRIELL